ncbi:SsgA family sporulation/cell division regulator [Streptomyces olivoreticuli]|uniref:SsgA family sporulation/cell division regulator n=1 Tax=Streptomyces olivoreticuli TaxID=68246 RepID=UPI000E23FA97|nr:SsgA family sporulation/cell division regulator [Streptomyces olivoreticuli]
MSTVIDQAVQARLIASAPKDRAVPAQLRYVPSDPFAVHIAFPPVASLDGADVAWAFARELLACGLLSPAGGGDVHVWPCGPDRTVLEFHAPEGIAMVQIDTAELRRFLARSYALVPAGTEIAHLDLDTDLTALLDSSP